MIDRDSYIRVKFRDMEIEIKGTEEFVEKHLSNIQDIFNSLSNFNSNSDSNNASKTKNITMDSPPQKLSIEDILKQDFSIWKKAISQNTNDTIIYVIAAYYIQSKNKNNYFTTQECYRQSNLEKFWQIIFLNFFL